MRVMYVSITGEVKNSFGRLIPVGNIIGTTEERGRELIRMDLAELVSHDVRAELLNQVTRIKNKEDTGPPPEERKRSWFGRLIGI